MAKGVEDGALAGFCNTELHTVRIRTISLASQFRQLHGILTFGGGMVVAIFEILDMSKPFQEFFIPVVVTSFEASTLKNLGIIVPEIR